MNTTPRHNDKYFTELDRQLQELAATDWPTFVELVGEDIVIAAKVCILRAKGKSLAQISKKLSLTKSMAETRCKKCLPKKSEADFSK
jgi:hypothetical protein